MPVNGMGQIGLNKFEITFQQGICSPCADVADCRTCCTCAFLWPQHTWQSVPHFPITILMFFHALSVYGARLDMPICLNIAGWMKNKLLDLYSVLWVLPAEAKNPGAHGVPSHAEAPAQKEQSGSRSFGRNMTAKPVWLCKPIWFKEWLQLMFTHHHRVPAARCGKMSYTSDVVNQAMSDVHVYITHYKWCNEWCTQVNQAMSDVQQHHSLPGRAQIHRNTHHPQARKGCYWSKLTATPIHVDVATTDIT